MTEICKDTRIVVVGGGKMGEAIFGGWIASGEGAAAELSAASITVAEPGEERAAYLAGTYGVTCVKDASEFQGADVILLSVKPQVLDKVLPVVAELPFTRDALVISIAAGWTTQRVESYLPEGTHVVRVMPNIPLLVGAGASTLCKGAAATDADEQLVCELFGCLGKAWIVNESDMDITCAINGSGPAYVAALIEALAAAAEKAGLTYEMGEALATQTVYGTAKLMLDKNQRAEKTRIDVCSPGGTTLAALGAMGENGFSEAMGKGVEAAIIRSKELGQA